MQLSQRRRPRMLPSISKRSLEELDRSIDRNRPSPIQPKQLTIKFNFQSQSISRVGKALTSIRSTRQWEMKTLKMQPPFKTTTRGSNLSQQVMTIANFEEINRNPQDSKMSNLQNEAWKMSETAIQETDKEKEHLLRTVSNVNKTMDNSKISLQTTNLKFR